MEEKAKQVLTKILYITIATASKNGVPWNSPVYSAFDHHYNFFWVSASQSRHSTNIRENNNIALVTYDSTVPEGTGFGVYIQGKAYELTDEQEIVHGLQCVFGRVGKNPPPIKDCLDPSPLRVYKAVPEKFWVNIDERYNGQYVDKRQEIQLL